MAAVALDRDLGQLDHLAVPLVVMAQIHQCRGELQKAYDAYSEALALAERIGEPQSILPATTAWPRSTWIAATAPAPRSSWRKPACCRNAPGSIPTRSSCSRSSADVYNWKFTAPAVLTKQVRAPQARADGIMTNPVQTPVQAGEPAPDFVVPAVHEERKISLADYRGNTLLLLGLFPGLYCPFCRRALAQMATTSERLKSLGVESLAIVGTELDNARLYFKFRPTRMTLGADPQLSTHRSYGVPRPVPRPSCST